MIAGPALNAAHPFVTNAITAAPNVILTFAVTVLPLVAGVKKSIATTVC